MYNGTNKTALCSQKQIAEAFVRLLEKMPYTAVSISAICKEANVSRQTFYALFEAKDNIVLYILANRHSFKPGETCCKKALSLEDLSREYCDYIIERKHFLKLLVENDIIYLMHECLYDSFIGCELFLPGKSDVYRAFGAEFVSGGLSGIAKISVERDTTTRGELERTITDLFAGKYFL